MFKHDKSQSGRLDGESSRIIDSQLECPRFDPELSVQSLSAKWPILPVLMVITLQVIWFLPPWENVSNVCRSCSLNARSDKNTYQGLKAFMCMCMPQRELWAMLLKGLPVPFWRSGHLGHHVWVWTPHSWACVLLANYCQSVLSEARVPRILHTFGTGALQFNITALC